MNGKAFLAAGMSQCTVTAELLTSPQTAMTATCGQHDQDNAEVTVEGVRRKSLVPTLITVDMMSTMMREQKSL
jgi:hypothetical protein